MGNSKKRSSTELDELTPQCNVVKFKALRKLFKASNGIKTPKKLDFNRNHAENVSNETSEPSINLKDLRYDNFDQTTSSVRSYEERPKKVHRKFMAKVNSLKRTNLSSRSTENSEKSNQDTEESEFGTENLERKFSNHEIPAENHEIPAEKSIPDGEKRLRILIRIPSIRVSKGMIKSISTEEETHKSQEDMKIDESLSTESLEENDRDEIETSNESIASDIENTGEMQNMEVETESNVEKSQSNEKNADVQWLSRKAKDSPYNSLQLKIRGRKNFIEINKKISKPLTVSNESKCKTGVDNRIKPKSNEKKPFNRFVQALPAAKVPSKVDQMVQKVIKSKDFINRASIKTNRIADKETGNTMPTARPNRETFRKVPIKTKPSGCNNKYNGLQNPDRWNCVAVN